MSRYEHAVLEPPSAESIKRFWSRTSDGQREKLIRKLKEGKPNGWGDPVDLRIVDDFDKLPEGLRNAVMELFRLASSV